MSKPSQPWHHDHDHAHRHNHRDHPHDWHSSEYGSDWAIAQDQKELERLEQFRLLAKTIPFDKPRMDVNFHQLKNFLRIARERSLSRAAEILRVRQPSVSIQIKNTNGP